METTSSRIRTVLVTGGSRGIGASIVRELAARGSNVGCGYHNNSGAAAVIASSFPGQVIPVRYELGSPASALAATAAVANRWGGLDAIVLNAGRWHGALLADADLGEWESLVHSGLSALAQIVQAAMPYLCEANNASITVVSSVVGVIGHPGDTAYATVKAGMIGFARSLAKEVGRFGIRVNVLAPGFVETAMTAAVPDGARARIEARSVLRRLGTAQEVARAAVFLSEDATYCTGTVLVADGGWSI